MKQLIQIFLMDLKMNFKHFMGAYMVIVPFGILLVLKAFIPSVESTTATLAVVSEGQNAVSQEMIQVLDHYATIKTYGSIDDMEQKLRGTGTVEGLYWDSSNEQYVSVLERTPKGARMPVSVASQVIRQDLMAKNHPEILPATEFSSEVPQELADRTKISPVATMGGSVFLVFMIIMRKQLNRLNVGNRVHNLP